MAQTKAGEQIEDRNLQKQPVLSVLWILRMSPEAVELQLGRKKQITRGKERDRQTDSQAAHGGIHLGSRGTGLRLGVQPGQLRSSFVCQGVWASLQAVCSPFTSYYSANCFLLTGRLMWASHRAFRDTGKLLWSVCCVQAVVCRLLLRHTSSIGVS